MKPDINNPKYPVGTKFRLTRDYCGHNVANSYKKGTYFVIESFGPGVFQPNDGFHSYFFRQCSKMASYSKETMDGVSNLLSRIWLGICLKW